jgi:N-acetylglucosamine-6-phosphate deacetylase
MTNPSATVHGYIATPEGFVHGRIEVTGKRISHLAGVVVSEDQVREGREPIVVPGFVDLHVHGAGGADMMDGGTATEVIARKVVQHGTTSMLATTLTAPENQLHDAFTALAAVMTKANGTLTQPGGARILGVHLEGPYISPDKLGAQPSFARAFSEGEFLSLHKLVPIRLVTLAPEIEQLAQVINFLQDHDAVVQLGHSNATYEQALAALQAGAAGFTHLYNAMSGLHHRAPGMVGAALAHSNYAEIIPDLLHVHPGAIRVALRSIARCYCVTDSMAAAGMPDGNYKLGTHEVVKCMGGVRLADGTLAGSTLTMDQAFSNLVNTLGLSMLEAAQRCATYACDFIGVHDRGALQVGRFADMVTFNRDLQLQQVWVEGHLQQVGN